MVVAACKPVSSWHLALGLAQTAACLPTAAPTLPLRPAAGAAPAVQAALAHPAARAAAGGSGCSRRCCRARGLHLNLRTAQVRACLHASAEEGAHPCRLSCPGMVVHGCFGGWGLSSAVCWVDQCQSAEAGPPPLHRSPAAATASLKSWLQRCSRRAAMQAAPPPRRLRPATRCIPVSCGVDWPAKQPPRSSSESAAAVHSHVADTASRSQL